MNTSRYLVRPGKRLKLKQHDTDDSGPFKDRDDAKGRLERGIERLVELQERLYAQDRWAVLLVFQAMDGAGKDSAIKHVMSGLNPQGTQVFSFKAPSHEELDHDFLWRTTRALPERGRIGIFNRSYYEEVLIVRVHPTILASQKLPSQMMNKRIWKDRYEDIVSFERYLSRNGTLIRKFFLHVSKDEQRRRMLERLDEPSKNWKFSLGDLKERERWDDYMEAYEDALSATSTDEAPWYVIPSDHKWFTRLLIADVIVEALESLDIDYPKLTDVQKRDLAEGRKLLAKDGGRQKA
jgi:PPK2 family polyphosphate:nucleotide phosphotransferase